MDDSSKVTLVIISAIVVIPTALFFVWIAVGSIRGICDCNRQLREMEDFKRRFK